MKVFLKALIIIGICLCSVLLIFGIYFTCIYIDADKIELNDSLLQSNFQKIEIYGKGGVLLSDVNSGYEKVEFTELNEQTINAFVAIEDRNFFNHNGINYLRLVKAAATNVFSFKFKEGASTISQQLVKNTVLTNEKTIKRKIKELRVTKKLEKKYSKEEILTMYLSAIYFGNGVSGIKAAAKFYYDKPVEELSLNEAATLAGIIKAPSKYAPNVNELKAKQRRDTVLTAMNECGYIDDNTLRLEIGKPIELNINKSDSTNLNYKFVLKEFDEIAENKGIKGGDKLKIFTNIASFSNEIILNNLDTSNFDYCLIILNNDGTIENITSNSCNSVINNRCPASLVKPLLVYAPSLEENVISPVTLIDDSKESFSDYSPENYNGLYYGKVTPRFALYKSLNLPSVKLLKSLGMEKAKIYGDKLGINVSDSDGLSVALGGLTSGLSPISVAKAYTVFPNFGTIKEFSYIERIESSDGKQLYLKDDLSKGVFSSGTASLVTDYLLSATTLGTAKKLKSKNFQVSAKTGTNGTKQGNYDAWCVAYDKNHTVLAWIGGKNGEVMPPDITGGTLPAKVVKSTFDELNKRGETEKLSLEEHLLTCKIDKYALEKDGKVLLATENTPEKYQITEKFDITKLPKSTSQYFTEPKIDHISLLESEDSVTLNIDTLKIYYYKIFDLDGNLVKTILGNGERQSVKLEKYYGEYTCFTVKPFVTGTEIYGIDYETNKIYNKERLIP